MSSTENPNPDGYTDPTRVRPPTVEPESDESEPTKGADVEAHAGTAEGTGGVPQ